MKRVVVTKISVGSLAKVFGFAWATIAFIVGVVTTVLVAAGTITSSTSFIKALGVSVAVFGLGIIVYPIIAFFIGWLQGAVVALILNLFFAESGGLRLHVEDYEEAVKK